MDNSPLNRNTYQRFNAVVAVLMNCLLINMIIRKSPKCLGAYKYLMIHIAVFEIAYEMIDFSLKIEVVTRGTVWLALCDIENTIVPEIFHYPGLLFWYFNFGLSLGNFAVHFIFRYFAIRGRRKVTNDCGARIILWIGSAMTFGVVWVLNVHFFNGRDSRKDLFIENELPKYRGVPVDRISYNSFSLYLNGNGTNGEKSWKDLTGLAIMNLLVGLSFATMLTFGFKCYKHLKTLTSQTSRSSVYKGLQSQLFFALVFQTLIPVVLMHIPIVLVLTVPLFDFSLNNENTELCGFILSFTISFFPVIDPLPNLIIIKPYRKGIIGYFKLLSCRNKQQSKKRMEQGPIEVSSVQNS